MPALAERLFLNAFLTGLGENLAGWQWIAGLGGEDRHHAGIYIEPAKSPLPDEPAHRQRRTRPGHPLEVIHGRASLDK